MDSPCEDTAIQLLGTRTPGYPQGRMRLMISDTYFTVPFEKGKVVVQTSEAGRVRAIRFDLEGLFVEKEAECELAEKIRLYFQGHRVTWDAIPDMEGLTDFKKRVYDRVARIPYGRTSTYGQIARDVNCRSGSRAVGQAMAGNRIPLIIPCHRVVSGNGTIGGFSSGTDLKRYLLRLEGVVL